MEIWGWCPLCRRWFYCPTWFDRDKPPPRCPVCQAEPTAIENRAGWQVPHRPMGYCSACGAIWFEGEQPLAASPRCGTTPSRLNYETAHGWRPLPPDSPDPE